MPEKRNKIVMTDKHIVETIYKYVNHINHNPRDN